MAALGAARWRKVQCHGDIPTGRIGHTMVLAKDNGVDSWIYMWGGVNETMEVASKYLDDFYRYRFASKTWEKVELSGEPPSARAFHSAVIHDNKMIVFGGCNGKGRFNKLHELDGETGLCRTVGDTEATGDPANANDPSTRYCHTAVTWNDRMYIFGGKCGGRNSNKRLADMYCFDFKTQMWEMVPVSGDVPTSRSAHSAVVYRDRMIMFGGRNAQGTCCDDLYEFDFNTGVWRMYHRPPTHFLFQRARHSVVLHQHALYTFAGWNGRKKLNDLFQYCLDTKQVSYVHKSDDTQSNLPCRRECHTAIVCNNTMVLFGGRFRGEFMNDSYELPLDPPSLKGCIRSYLLDTDEGALIDFKSSRWGLPDGLIQYLTCVKGTVRQRKAANPFEGELSPVIPTPARFGEGGAAIAPVLSGSDSDTGSV